jgi:hypothetical protein
MSPNREPNQIASTMKYEEHDAEFEQRTQVQTRACLVCKKPFESQWAGERICRSCKSTATWRSGALGKRG